MRRCRSPPTLDVASVKSGTKQNKKRDRRETFPVAGTTTDPQAGLGAPFPGSGAAEPPLPSARSPQPPLFLEPIRAFKNTSLDTHKPTVAFPEPTEMHIFLRKNRVFPTTKQLQEDRSCFVPVSYLPFTRRGEERTTADVNTGNDTENRGKIEEIKRTSCMKTNRLWIANHRSHFVRIQTGLRYALNSEQKEEKRHR